MFLKEYRIKRKYKKVVSILGSNTMFKKCRTVRSMAMAGKDQEAERMLKPVKVVLTPALKAAKVTGKEFTFILENFDKWGK